LATLTKQRNQLFYTSYKPVPLGLYSTLMITDATELGPWNQQGTAHCWPLLLLLFVSERVQVELARVGRAT
jgi:hypothetical protein